MSADVDVVVVMCCAGALAGLAPDLVAGDPGRSHAGGRAVLPAPAQRDRPAADRRRQDDLRRRRAAIERASGEHRRVGVEDPPAELRRPALPGGPAGGPLQEADDVAGLQVGVHAAHERGRRGDLGRGHRRALQVGVAAVAVVARAAPAAGRAVLRPAALEHRGVRRERAEQAGRTAIRGDRAVRGERDLAAAPGERRTRVVGGRGGHGEALAGGDVRPGAARLQDVRGRALLADGPVGRRRHEHDPAGVGVVDRVDHVARRDPVVVGAEAHVDRVRAAVDGVADRRGDRRVRQIGLLDDEPAPVSGAGDADPVARRGARDRGDVRPVAVLVDGRRAARRIGVLVDGRAQHRRDLRMRPVDAGVDDRDRRARAVDEVPRARGTRTAAPTTGRAARSSRRRRRRGSADPDRQASARVQAPPRGAAGGRRGGRRRDARERKGRHSAPPEQVGSVVRSRARTSRLRSCGPASTAD